VLEPPDDGGQIHVRFESRFGGAMTRKFGGTHGSGAVGQSIFFQGAPSYDPKHDRVTITLNSSRDVDPEAVARREGALTGPAQIATLTIKATDVATLRQIIRDEHRTAYTVQGRVNSVLLRDNRWIIQLRSGVNLTVHCSPETTSRLAEDHGKRGQKLRRRQIRVTAPIRAQDGGSASMHPRDANDLAIID
jgi:hypothetical protein